VLVFLGAKLAGVAMSWFCNCRKQNTWTPFLQAAISYKP
jgi:hypothetical protein